MIPTALFVLCITFFISPAMTAQITRTAFPQTAAWDTVKQHSFVPHWYVMSCLQLSSLQKRWALLSSHHHSSLYIQYFRLNVLPVAWRILFTEELSIDSLKKDSPSVIFLSTCYNVACICKITRVNSSSLLPLKPPHST